MIENFNTNSEYASWKAEAAEKSPESECKIDFELMENSFSDGTAGEYYNNTGALPVEAFLEEQGDERAWSEIVPTEQQVIGSKFRENVGRYNLNIADDSRSLMAFAA